MKNWLKSAVVVVAVLLFGTGEIWAAGKGVEAGHNKNKPVPPPIIQVDVATEATPIYADEAPVIFLGYGFQISEVGNYEFSLPPGVWEIEAQLEIFVDVFWVIPLGFQQDVFDWWVLDSDPLGYVITFKQLANAGETPALPGANATE